MSENTWSKLNSLQVGRYAEYFAITEFTKAGKDVYRAEVDDKGIDFVVRKNENEYFDVQVKSKRNKGYIFMKKRIFVPRKNLLLAIVLFEENQDPTLLLIPSLDWSKKSCEYLVGRDYRDGQKSEAEWGLNITKKNVNLLKERYNFNKQVDLL